MWWLRDMVAWRQTPETRSEVVAFTNCEAQANVQKYIFEHI